jgi:hyperosmotically inducible protein
VASRNRLIPHAKTTPIVGTALASRSAFTTNARNVMQAKLTRKTILAGAIAAALSLAACGDNRDDATRTSRVDTPASTSTTTTADRLPADASTAAKRAEQRADQADNVAVNGAERARDRVENAGDKAANTASDAAMTAKVKARLMAEPGIDSLDIDVDTDNGRVILSGNVDTPQHRARAKELASSVEGVTGVVDRMSVQKG